MTYWEYYFGVIFVMCIPCATNTAEQSCPSSPWVEDKVVTSINEPIGALFGRIDFATMIMIDDLPLRFIERERFRHFMSVTQPEFKLVSLNMIVKDRFSIYMPEWDKLKDVLTKFCQ